MLEKLYNLIMIISLFCSDKSCGSPYMVSEIARQRSDNLNYQLNRNVLPQHYTLKISPDIDKKTFTGNVSILIRVTKPIIKITLHQQNLTITQNKIYLTAMDGSIIPIKSADVSGTKEQEFYTITLKNTLQINTYNLLIPEFYGVMNDNKRGIYLIQYKDKNDNERTFATTEFEPTNARAAFPCFDEPSFRATFQIYITRPSNYHSISNTKLIKSKKLTHSNLYEDEFETTPSMPTYLVAFVISQMKLSPESDKNFYRILARPLAVELGYEKYALKMGKMVLPTLETYFKVNYSLNKVDQVAMPVELGDIGGKENWGLITYVEPLILFTPLTTTSDHLTIDFIITHEYAHQWFGNLVTLKWWKYIWLTEGFATFFQNRILDKIKPEWKMMEQFIVNTKQGSLLMDSTELARTMTQDVGTPAEIMMVFDGISYQKAACVIHMLETIMTSAVFQRGVTNYLQDRAFQSAIPNDLYRNFQKAMTKSGKKLPKNLNINKIMTTWESLKGCPLIYVERSYGIKQEVVKLTQSRLTMGLTKETDKYPQTTEKPWFVPINYATKNNPNFKDTQFNDWLLKTNAKITIKNLRRTEWLILNKQQAYYYRVNYDMRNWKLITEALLKNYTKIHILNRAQLLDDSFMLAMTNKLSFEIFLKISTYLYDDDNYITHYTFLRAAQLLITSVLTDIDASQLFQTRVMKILKPAYERLGHNVTSKDTLIDKLHRTLVIDWMCMLNYAQCREKSREMFNLWRFHNVQIPVDLEKPILCGTMRKENQSDWEYLFKMYPSFKNNEGFKQNAFQSLGCTKDIYSLKRLLDVSLKASTGSKYDFFKVANLLSDEGLVGIEVVMNYLGAHFNPLLATFGNQYITSILITIASKLTMKKQVKKLDQILQNFRSAKEAQHFDLTEIHLRVSANEKRVHQISKYLKSIWANGTPSLTIPDTRCFSLYSLLIIILLL